MAVSHERPDVSGATKLFRQTRPDGTVLFGELAVGPAKLLMSEEVVAEMFWGERYRVVRDPDGHRWALCTRREQLDPDEVAQHPPDVP